MKNINKKSIIEIIKKSSIFLLLEFIMILLVTTILFFVNVTITSLHLPIITLLTIIIYMIFYKKDDKRLNIIAIILGIIIFAGITFVEGKVYDTTADGNTYHKLAIGSMKNGWNPAYEDSQDFKMEDGNAFDTSEDNINTLWIDHYAKGTEIFAAVIYAFTGNIESGKGYTLLLMYIAFGIIFSYLYTDRKRNIFTSLIIPFLLVVNAITIVQIFNYYVDGALMISILLILYSCIVESIKDKYEGGYNQKENLLILACNIILCINIKFTGLAFAAIFCFVFYVYWLIKTYMKEKENFIKVVKKYTLFYIITVIASIGIIGYSSYTRNMIDHGHPLYPLYGKGHVDNMVVKEQPSSFADKNHLEIFLISIFSKGENVSPTYSEANIQPTLKIPGTITIEEINNYSIPDIRVGGFGPLFSIVFIVSIISTIYIIIKFIKEKKWDLFIPYILILLVIAFLILLLDGNYWARYIPYFYAIPIFTLTYLLWDNDKKIKYTIGVILSIIMIINISLVTYANLKATRANDLYARNKINEFVQYAHDNEVVEIKLNHSGVQGALYNIDDRGVTNYVVKEEVEQERDGYFFKY